MGRDRCTLGFPYRAFRAGLVFCQEGGQRLGLPRAFSCPPGSCSCKSIVGSHLPSSLPEAGLLRSEAENLWEARPRRSSTPLLLFLVVHTVNGHNYPLSSSDNYSK